MKSDKKHIKEIILPLLLSIAVAVSAAGCANSSSGSGTAEESSSAVSGKATPSEDFADSEESADSRDSAALGNSEGNIALEDGTYQVEVTLEGGSGKASVESPCPLMVTDGRAVALLTWSSANYDYMIVDGEKYLPVNETGNSQFEIPVSTLDEGISVQADTTAMSQPYLIDYTLTFHLADSTQDTDPAASAGGAEGIGTSGSGETESAAEGSSAGDEAAEDIGASVPEAPVFQGLILQSTDENVYAQCYRIYRYSDGYAVIAVSDGREYFLVPEGAAVPELADAEVQNQTSAAVQSQTSTGAQSQGSAETGNQTNTVTSELVVLQLPLDRIYLAATAAMCQFDSLDAVDRIILSGTEEEDWSIDSAREAMASGQMLYGGKYSAPDYEQIVSLQCDLAIESTMILHTPKVQEKLEQLGIPVFIDRSSYEPEPLGRTEWVKVYGLLTGEEEKAKAAFAEQEQYVEQLQDAENTGKTVAIFAINSSHQIVTRRADDYYGKMIAQAGGVFVTPAEAESGNAVSTVTVSVEDFYAAAAEADYLIYNGSIEDAPTSVAALVAEDSIFRQFHAVQQGNVWYTDRSLYQNANRIGTLIDDLHTMLTDSGEETVFLHKMTE